MNLARIEHYFARFLSATEVRARSRDGCAEVELYPGHGTRLTPNLVSVCRCQALRPSAAKRFRRRARMEMKAIVTNAMR
jgi:hypothetical protein